VLAAYDAALSAPSGCLSGAEEARLSAWRGAVALAAGEGTGALAMTDRALAHGDREVSTLSNRALALEMLGRRVEAAVAWGRVAERAPGTVLERRARERFERLER
jgi:Flp pilus assembly protein TadD